MQRLQANSLILSQDGHCFILSEGATVRHGRVRHHNTLDTPTVRGCFQCKAPVPQREQVSDTTIELNVLPFSAEVFSRLLPLSTIRLVTNEESPPIHVVCCEVPNQSIIQRFTLKVERLHHSQLRCELVQVFLLLVDYGFD